MSLERERNEEEIRMMMIPDLSAFMITHIKVMTMVWQTNLKDRERAGSLGVTLFFASSAEGSLQVRLISQENI